MAVRERRALWNGRPSFDEFPGGPDIALNEDFAVRRHAGFGESDRSFELQFHADDLLHAIVAEIRIFRCEGRLRIDTQDISVNGLFRRRIEVDTRGLADLHFADLAFRE